MSCTRFDIGKSPHGQQLPVAVVDGIWRHAAIVIANINSQRSAIKSMFWRRDLISRSKKIGAMNQESSKRFEFHIADLARFLDKSPATIRKWEEEGYFVSPRGENKERTFHAEDIRLVVAKAADIGRIDPYRQHIVESLMTIVETLEVMNGASRVPRSIRPR